MGNLSPFLRIYNLIVGMTAISLAYTISSGEITSLTEMLINTTIPFQIYIITGMAMGIGLSIVALNDDIKSGVMKWTGILLIFYLVVSFITTSSGDPWRGVFSSLYGLYILGVFFLFSLPSILCALGTFTNSPSLNGTAIFLTLVVATFHFEGDEAFYIGITMGIFIVLWILGVFLEYDYSEMNETIKEGMTKTLLDDVIVARIVHSMVVLIITLTVFYVFIWTTDVSVMFMPVEVRESMELQTHYANLFFLVYVLIIIWAVAMVISTAEEGRKKVLLLKISMKRLYRNARAGLFNVGGRRGASEDKTLRGTTEED